MAPSSISTFAMPIRRLLPFEGVSRTTKASFPSEILQYNAVKTLEVSQLGDLEGVSTHSHPEVSTG